MATDPQPEGRQRTSAWRRVTVRLPPDQLAGIEQRVEDGHDPNRSAAIRRAVDRLLDRESERPSTDHGGDR